MADGTKPALALMLQGTGSDVGKSLVTAGLCRAFANRGLRVAPFKPQNMSNNAAVTPDGGEIGRAQALQARAARLELSRHMNPVLLKPQSETGAQVVVQGRAQGSATAKDYHGLKRSLMPRVLESFDIVSQGMDLVLIEGAGSAAEVNLRASDIANMGFAEAADVPVVLVGDIDRGGVIASLVGCYALLTQSEKVRTKGYIINKFRGDPALFDDAHEIIRQRTGMTNFGMVPYLAAARALPKEDAMALDNAERLGRDPDAVRIAVPRFSRIANFDDLDPLASEPDVSVEVVEPGKPLPVCDMILLPGSKSTLADLAFLRAQGWDVDILGHLRRGGVVVGLCGGFQMMGERIGDPDGIEGPKGESPGLGLFAFDTVMGSEKTLRQVEGVEAISGEALRGYEMHMGRTSGPALGRPWLTLGAECRPEGAVDMSGRLFGSYVHGMFAEDGFRRAFLSRLRPDRQATSAYESGIEAALDALARHLEEHLDLDGLLATATLRR